VVQFETLPTEQLIEYMRTIIWDANLKRWTARVNNGHVFGQGYTPRAAMLDAISLAAGGQPERNVAEIPLSLEELESGLF